MAHDDDYRRRESNDYLNRRQDRLDFERSQRDRTSAVYDGIREKDEGKVRRALDIPLADTNSSSSRTSVARLRQCRRFGVVWGDRDRYEVFRELLAYPKFSIQEKMVRFVVLFAGFTLVDKLRTFGLILSGIPEPEELKAILDGLTTEQRRELGPLPDTWANGIVKIDSGS